MQNVQSTVFEASITPGSDNIKHPGFKRMEGVAETLPVRTTLLALQTDFKIRGMLCLRASELGHPTTSSKAGDRLSANDRLTRALAFLFVGIHCDGSPVVRAGLRYSDIWRLIQPLLESVHATDFVRAVQRGVYEHWRVYAPSGGWGGSNLTIRAATGHGFSHRGLASGANGGAMARVSQVESNGSTTALRQQHDHEKLVAAARTRSNKSLPLSPKGYMLQILADLELMANPADFQNWLLRHEDQGTRLLDGTVDPARLRAIEAVISEFVPPVKGGDLTRRSAQLQARK